LTQRNGGLGTGSAQLFRDLWQWMSMLVSCDFPFSGLLIPLDLLPRKQGKLL
jgi:hypothetical protein